MAVPMKVLVVEDEAGVALLLESMLDEIGCEVVACVARLAVGLEIAGSVAVDLAVLDVNLAGEAVFPLAVRLVERGIPFIFCTGYGSATLPADLCDRPVLTKPFTLDRLERAVAAAMQERAP
jgi:two-component SAPR family response regulator